MSLPNLDTKSVLNVVNDNFKEVSLKTYAIRMIYIGEHNLSKLEVIEQFNKSVNDVNGGYCDINVNGLLLVYDSYFVHILEGSEDTVHRQLRFLFQNELQWIEEISKRDKEEATDTIIEDEAAVEAQDETKEDDKIKNKPQRKMFERLKMLIVFHSLSQMMFCNWRAVYARPPSLVGKLDLYGPLNEHMEQLRICLDKISNLCTHALTEENLSFEGLSAVDPKIEALPEVALLDFLLQSPFILELRQVVFLHRRVDDYCFYYESVWPIPTHYTPRNLYKLKVDDSFVEPLPIMPWEMVKKEANEDEEREERSGSSSSD